METPPLFAALVLLALAGSLSAQTPQATPGPNDPFKDFGHTGLDQKPAPKSTRPGTAKRAAEMQQRVADAALRATPAPAPGVVRNVMPAEMAARQRAAANGPPKPLRITVVVPPANARDLLELTSARSLSFDAKTATSGGAASQRSGSGERTTTREQSPELDLQVRNLGRLPEHTHFDWFFIAKDIGRTGMYIWDTGEAELDVPGNGVASKTIESMPIERRTTVGQRLATYYVPGTGTIGVPYSTVTREGAVPHGWIVRMFVDGRLAGVQASSPELERVGRDPKLGAGAPR